MTKISDLPDVELKDEDLTVSGITGVPIGSVPLGTAAVMDVKEALAREAVKIVTGARRGAYGKPENNFQRIANFWNVYFENRGLTLRDQNNAPVYLKAADVSPMMRLMKEARLCETPDHRDSLVDLIGYTLTGAEVNGVKA